MGLAVSREHAGRGDRFAGTISWLCHHEDVPPLLSLDGIVAHPEDTLIHPLKSLHPTLPGAMTPLLKSQ